MRARPDYRESPELAKLRAIEEAAAARFWARYVDQPPPQPSPAEQIMVERTLWMLPAEPPYMP